MPTSTVLAVARNLDVMPIGGVEVFGSLTGTVPNDGAWHTLAEPAGYAPLKIDPKYQTIVRYIRAEWSTADIVLPPPLTLNVTLNGQSSIALTTFAQLTLLAVAQGPPAIEQRILAIVQPGATISAAVRNTGTVTQQVDLFFTGWSYPQTLPDGAGYAVADRTSVGYGSGRVGALAGRPDLVGAL